MEKIVSHANGMLISVITPTFNSERTIEKNILSIIGQSYNHFEHIIIDNNSKDNTINIINKVYEENHIKDKLITISEKDYGIADAFNKGIKKAGGKIIAILNSDDVYYNDNVFAKTVSAFENESILIVYGNVFFNDRLYGSNIRFPVPDKATGGLQFIHPSMFFRKEVYENLGLYNNDYRLSMDYEYYCRLAKNFKDLKSRIFYIKDEPLVKMNAGGASWNNELKSIEEIKKALIEHGFWNRAAKNFYAARKTRTMLKKNLTKLHINFLVKIWRRIKYGN